ncbi:TetR/AcrR family transcriptional regulator [uncultured Sphingomonas sp.]|uniref:TetR/AcrR family transcriptional regulator n=1 Tax=uncultured Sphingomonas sp. TaxID=158754 RepID=UPI0035C978F3
MIEVGGTNGSRVAHSTEDIPRPLSRSAKSAKKRDAIIVAATAILNARTYALATMTEIAAALDLRDATLYYYFPSKQALFYACHCRSMTRFERFLTDADRAEASGAAKLEHLLSRLVHDSARHGPLLFFGEYFHLEAHERDEIADWADRLTIVLERFVETGIADGSIRPCEIRLVVQLLLGMLIWLAKWVPGVEGLTADRLLAAIGVFGLHGLDNRDP